MRIRLIKTATAAGSRDGSRLSLDDDGPGSSHRAHLFTFEHEVRRSEDKGGGILVHRAGDRWLHRPERATRLLDAALLTSNTRIDQAPDCLPARQLPLTTDFTAILNMSAN
jgi:hypothetical protein